MEEFLKNLISTWWGILIIVLISITIWILLSAVFYRAFFKRFYDILISLISLVCFSPLLIALTIIGAIKMKGNPFFLQKRPGKKGKDGKERIFRLIKFRTMSNQKDQDGNLLPDQVRLNKYGRILRVLSLDELPELINIIKGDMSIVGPRPLAVQYLEYYTEEEHRRHDVFPGLTGLAQVNGRNCINWPERFAFDLEYVDNLSLYMDLKIIFKTIFKVLKRSDVTIRSTGSVMDFDEYRRLESAGKLYKNDESDDK